MCLRPTPLLLSEDGKSTMKDFTVGELLADDREDIDGSSRRDFPADVGSLQADNVRRRVGAGDASPTLVDLACSLFVLQSMCVLPSAFFFFFFRTWWC